MMRLYQYIWQSLSLRIFVGWLIVSVLPTLLMWSDYLIKQQLLLTQVNSIAVSSFSIIVILIVLQRLTQFPGQKSVVTVLPVIMAVTMLAGSLLLIFRLEYSVYYLIASFILAILYCLISQLMLHALFKPVIGYVPVGRSQNLSDIEGVQWIELSKNFLIQNKKQLPFQSIVADLADSSLDEEWERLLAQTTLCGIPVYNVLQVRESLTGRLPIKHLYENNLGSLLPSQFYLLFKRLMDTLIILISSPIVFVLALFVILGIKWESRHTGGSVLFTQTRVGQGGRLFTMYKFRSMLPTSEAYGAKMAVSGDMRITKFGHFIRKTRLDELPQFINVLKGEMSLIGPRPEQPSFVEQFNQTIPFYAYRHIVKPGISGWAQVMHGYASDEDETKVKLEHDFFYIKNFSLTLDLLIVIKTIQTMMTGFGAR